MEIKSYNDPHDRGQVIALWRSVFGYQDKRNDPDLVIEKKLEVNDKLFFVAHSNETIIGTVMGGYDGHRGWIYSLAVAPDYRGTGVGRALLSHVENALASLGCLKINLQILESNRGVIDFYCQNGYSTEDRISMGKEISKNIPG